jgi:RimJ/RimL family protein N-acetyltransferase
VRIVHLCEAVHAALADGDLDGAGDLAPVPLTAAFVQPDWRPVWARRRDQIRADPAAAAWVTGAVWDVEERRTVGRAGFHGPPDRRGMVEVGYEVHEGDRRRGYGRATLAALLDRAHAEPQVGVVRAAIAPDNTASLALAAQFAFVQVGEQWDDEDGLELVFELRVGDPGR